MRFITAVACLALLAACAKTPEGTFVQDGASVIVTPASGKEWRVRLDVRTDRIVRVTSVNDGNFDLPKSLMVVDGAAPAPAFKAEKRDGAVRSTPASSSHGSRSRTAP